MAALTVVSVLALALISIALIWAMVRKPVRELIAGTHHLAEGNLDHRIPVSSNDEIGMLAASFNHMTEQLRQAREEVLEWTRTLEERVREKSDELERAYQHLVQSEKMVSLGKLSAVVAHEINNPLAGILTYAKLVERMAERGFNGDQRLHEAKGYLHTIESESRRCGVIVKNLLTFARQAPLSPQKNNLNEIVERCLLLVGHQLELQSIDLEKHLEASLPPIYCDSAQVQQALLALLVNAIEAMPQGGRLRVTTSYDRARGEATVSISDEGPGIPPDVLPHIFEPFFTTKEEGQGVGLGLAVAFGIVSQHGGTIDAASTPQKGTTFTVALPEEPRPARERVHKSPRADRS
jgi:two-component system NtrC family sensor kinase